MLTETERELVEIILNLGLGEDIATYAVSGLDDEQEKILLGYIRKKLSYGDEITEETIILAVLYLLGAIEFEEDEDDENW